MCMKKIKELFILFISMFKIGLFTFGGGYAMISVFENEFVSKKKYLEHDEFMNILVVAESTPGPVAINMATYIGYKRQRIIGSIFATLGMVLPSFIIISALSVVLSQLLIFEPVAFAFNGIRAGVIALIVKAFWGMAKQCPKNLFSLIMAIFAFCLVMFTSVNIVYVILSGALVGISVALISKKGGNGK